MELKEIIELIKHPETILAVPQQEEVIDYCTMWIHNLEEDLMNLDFQLDEKLAKLVEIEGSVAAAEVKLRLDDKWRERKKKELLLKSLKSYRQNIRRKRDRILK